mgnify:CR=1 FL=1
MKPEDYYWHATNGTGSFGFGNQGFYGQSRFHQAPPKPYIWPEPEEQFPVLQEGDHGMFIITQASMGWRQKALDALTKQIEEREAQLGCELMATAENLPDGSLLVEWKRHKCEAILGGPK